jgi:hypothetical protein
MERARKRILHCYKRKSTMRKDTSRGGGLVERMLVKEEGNEK